MLVEHDEVREALRASRRRRVLGAVGGGMVGSGMAALAVSGLDYWLGKSPLIVWLGLALGIPLAIIGGVLIHRIGD